MTVPICGMSSNRRTSVMKELELKIEVTPSAAERLAQSPAVLRFGEGAAVEIPLRTLYLDTPDLALAARSIALRLRHDGTGWIQSVKAQQQLSGGMMEAVEDERPLIGPTPDLDAIAEPQIRAEITQTLADATPVPAFETRFTRRARRLALPNLGTVELAIDQGEICAGDRSEPISEVEIELVAGNPRAVFEVARLLFPDGGVLLARNSKADRGAQLARGETLAAGPRMARPIALARNQTTEAAARAVIAECLDQISANIAAVLQSPDPEGPHQLRVGLRRLRSALLAFKTPLESPELGRLDSEARWLALQAGRLRDLDVARDEIVTPLAAQMPEEPGFGALLDALEVHRAAASAQLTETLSGRRAWTFLLDLGAFAAARGWLDPADWDQTARLAQPVDATAAAALEVRAAKALKRGTGIAALSIDARHDLRKELKKLRYCVEFFSGLFQEKAARAYVKRLKELQAIFGDLQDAAMAEALFRAPDGPAAGDVGAARAAGIAIGVRTERAERAWKDAKTLWQAFRSAPRFWS